MCDGDILLTDSDIAQIEEITQTYLTPKFIYGSNPRCTNTIQKRVDGVGEFQISIELDHNIIKDINIAGDFFVLGSICLLYTSKRAVQRTESDETGEGMD